MKRSDLHVGDELYLDGTPDWAVNAWGHKATIVDLGWWKTRNGQPTQMPEGATGSGILADVEHPISGVVSRQVVYTGHLRGPYAQTRAACEAAVAARQAERDAREVEADRVSAAAYNVAERAKAEGHPAIVLRDYRNLPHIALPPGDFVRLLDLASRKD